ncbi:MAG TPA: M1 family metallopeptidase [Gemmatimonadales bacterium]|nr:M1 family metallopeptidase [Gemmatimonadales bacterium]
MIASLIAFLAVGDTVRVPGAYWQQEVSYAIDARLDEARQVLEGRQRMAYVNHSPDTLRAIAFHLHLNAFRPHSDWSRADAREARRRFNDLADPDHGFNHVRDVTVDGAPVTAEYPFAPDSTIVRFRLPKPLLPGERLDVRMAFDARPSTVPRRQGRRGRHYDFAHWYPKVVVYDRLGWNEKTLEPAGEFYGEFATYSVQLDVPEDQVVGATGIPVCGDPGWARASAQPGRVPEYGRGRYGDRPGVPPGETCPGTTTPGRKTILWHAEDVHHFALSMNPDYKYEGGASGRTLIHVLYRPGDEQTWGGGVAVSRTAIALQWLDRLFGPFAWPQITNVHRIDGGGTEFPMMMHNGSAGQGLIVHELGHNYVMGILANNEWREGWMDEGFSEFQQAWFAEVMGETGWWEDGERSMLSLELDDAVEPAGLPSYAFKDFTTYNLGVYSRGELFLHRLRYVVGDDTMQRILREYYRRWQLRHVTESSFRNVAEEVSGRDLGRLFAQGLHDVVLYDYAVGEVKRREVRAVDSLPGAWLTRVEVKRLAEGILPIEVMVAAAEDTMVVRLEGERRSEWVEIATRTKPVEVRLDPRGRVGDWNMLNNVHAFGFDVVDAALTLHPHRPVNYRFDTWFSEHVERDRLVQSWMPMAWYNDVGGMTYGIRSRDNYLGRFERNQFWVSVSTGEPDAQVSRVDFFARVRDPVGLRAPGFSPTVEAFRIEGRWGGLLQAAWEHRPHRSFGPTYTNGLALRLVGVDDARFLDPGVYEPVSVAEFTADAGVRTRTRTGWRLALGTTLGAGLVFDRDALAPLGRDREQFYLRGTLEATARRALGTKWGLGVRAFAGFSDAIGGEDELGAPLQRQMFVANADPFGQLNNPFLRSQGALLVGDDAPYHAPGGGGVRGADFRVVAPALVALNAELERTLTQKRGGGLFNRVAVAAFGDAAQGIGEDEQRAAAERVDFIADAGVGIRASHRIGDTPFETRFDFPIWLSEPGFARNEFAREDELDFRWIFSVQAAF